MGSFLGVADVRFLINANTDHSDEFDDHPSLRNNTFDAAEPLLVDWDNDGVFEPRATTSATGAAVFEVLPAFDRNGDGVLSLEEGRVIAVGGIDIATRLPVEVSFTAPVAASGQTIVTPLTTLATVLMTEHGLTAENAAVAIRGHFGLAAVDIFGADPLKSVQLGDAGAAERFAAGAKLHDTVQQIARLLATAGGGSVSNAAGAAFLAIAARIVAGDPADVTSQSDIEALLRDVLTATATALDNATTSAAAEVIAAGNQQIDAIPPDATDFITRIKAVQQTAQRPVADDLTSAGLRLFVRRRPAKQQHRRGACRADHIR